MSLIVCQDELRLDILTFQQTNGPVTCSQASGILSSIRSIFLLSACINPVK
jgi:hypothetical protein